MSETILYVIDNESLGWRKLGIGFGNRLEKWRREGWVLEQQVLFDSREDALLAESMLKRRLTALVLDRQAMPPEGHTEMWPYSWGTLDLAEVHKHVSDFSARMLQVWSVKFWTSVLVEISDDFENRRTKGEVSDEESAEHLAGLTSILNAAQRAMVTLFVESEEPTFTRESLEKSGLDWAALMRQRQDYRTFHGGRGSEAEVKE